MRGVDDQVMGLSFVDGLRQSLVIVGHERSDYRRGTQRHFVGEIIPLLQYLFWRIVFVFSEYHQHCTSQIKTTLPYCKLAKISITVNGYIRQDRDITPLRLDLA